MSNEDYKKEFFFKGNDKGCLLVHGFSSTPAELRELAERLSSGGFTVLAVRLAGHGTEIEDMEKCTYNDWIKSVEEGYMRLKDICKEIYVIGHSMGSLLALYIAENHVVDKIVTLAPAIITKDKNAKFVPIVKHFIRYIEWKAKNRPEEEAKYLLGYRKIPLASVHELGKLQRIVRKQLPKINKPILIIQSHKDQTVDEKGVEVIEKNVTSQNVKKIYLNNCGHNITVECEKENVFTEVTNFLLV